MPACQPKRTKFAGLISFIAFTLAISVFSGCGGNKNDAGEQPGSHSVSFNSNGGSSVLARSVQPGGAAPEPAPAPSRAGYVFEGWYTDNNTFTNKVSFPYYPTGNITLHAKWTPIDDGDPDNPPPDDPGEIESSAMFSITGIALDRKTGTVKIEISAESPARLNIDILQDVIGLAGDWKSGEKLAGGVLNIKEPVDNAFVAVKVSSALPKYFIVVASLTDDDGENLCDPFTFIEYTEAYEKFMATTIHDFPAEKVLNLDASEDNNFMVTASGVAIIKAGENGNNNLDPALSDGNTYVFHNAGEEILRLSIGGRIVVTANDGKDTFLIKVAKITIAGSDVTIVASDANELSDFFDFIKIDKSEYVDTVTLDMSEADEGVEFYADPNDLPDVFADDDGQTVKAKALGIKAVPDIINVRGTASTGLNFTLGLNDNYVILNGSLSIKLKCTAAIRYSVNLLGKNYYYIKYSIGFEGDASVNIGARIGSGDGKIDKSRRKDETITFAQIIFPLGATGLSANAKLQFNVDWALNGTVKFTAKVHADGGFISQSRKSLEFTGSKGGSAKIEDASGDFSIAAGPQLVPGISFWAGALEGDLELFAGVDLRGDIKRESVDFSSDKDEEIHACETYVDGSLDLFMKTTYKFLLLWETVKIEYNAGEIRVPLYSFHVSFKTHPDSVFGGKTGFITSRFLEEIDCPNKVYKTTFSPEDEEGNVLSDAYVTVKRTTSKTSYVNYGPFTRYLYQGQYVASASLDGYKFTDEYFTVAKPTEILKETRTIIIKAEEGRNITFSPRDEEGNVLTNAAVTVKSTDGTTYSGTGQFEKYLYPDNYVASASLAGYKFTDEPFTVDKDIIARTIIIKGKEETGTYEITFIPQDEKGNVLTDASVTVGNVNGTIYRKTGEFSENIPPGNYWVSTSLDGYRFNFFVFTVVNKEQIIVIKGKEDMFAGEMVRVDSGTFTMGCTPEKRSGGGDYCYISDALGAETCYYHYEDYDYIQITRCYTTAYGPECSITGYNVYDEVCRDEEVPAHQVTLTRDYEIGRYEVTQAQWKAIMGADNNPSYFKGDNLPVENVSWDAVQEFINKLNEKTGGNYRLPTEAEWEYAARAGRNSVYRYSGSNDVEEVAWYSDNSGGETHPVGRKSQNRLGIYDMSGNVSEMVSGWLGEYSDSPQTDPGESWGSWNRGIRGGNWADDWWKASGYTDKNWYVLGARVWARGDDRPNPYYPSNRVGFRLARGW